MRVFLVRHTEYLNPNKIYAFHLPLFLSPEGREKAKRIGKWFVENNYANLPIFTSPVVRTVQTAEIIASQTNSFVETDVRLIESISKLEGTKQPEIDALKNEYDYSTRETVDSVQKRTVEVFEEKIKEGKDCILVSHGDQLTILLYHLIKVEIKDDFYTNTGYVKRGEIVKIEIGDPFQVERFTV